MSFINALRQLKQRCVHLMYVHCPKLLPDKMYLSVMYLYTMGKEMHWDNPRTFNEKLQWLKVYDRKTVYTIMVDKYAVKQYVANIIGQEYIIPTLGVWNKFDEIDFENLPNQFVLKCTHDSGGLIVCKDKSKLDIAAARKKIERCLNRNFYYQSREWPYKNVPPRIIAEQYMEDSGSIDLKDYKLMCFHGKVKCCFVCSERSERLKVTFFDNVWKKMPFERHYPASETPIVKPRNYEVMIRLAEILSDGIPFVRVDFYEINGKVYFGDLNFYPGGGFEEFKPEEWDYTLGSWIHLPNKLN